MYFKTSNKPTFLYPQYTFFHKETRITVLILNRQHVFHLESETLWCSGYKKTFKLGEPQPRPTIYVVLLSQLLHRTSVLISSFSFCFCQARITSAGQYMDFLRFNLTRMFKIVIRFVPAGAEVDFSVLLHSLLCGV